MVACCGCGFVVADSMSSVPVRLKLVATEFHTGSIPTLRLALPRPDQHQLVRPPHPLNGVFPLQCTAAIRTRLPVHHCPRFMPTKILRSFCIAAGFKYITVLL